MFVTKDSDDLLVSIFYLGFCIVGICFCFISVVDWPHLAYSPFSADNADDISGSLFQSVEEDHYIWYLKEHNTAISFTCSHKKLGSMRTLRSAIEWNLRLLYKIFNKNIKL